MSRRRRFPGLFALAAGLTLLAGSLAAAPASAAGEQTTLSQSHDSEPPGTDHAMTATVNDGSGNPVADGTKVTFAVDGPRGGVLVDNIYVGIAVDASKSG